MFSPHTITRMTEQLRQLQDEVSATEQELEKKKAAVSEWSELLAYAEQHPALLPPSVDRWKEALHGGTTPPAAPGPDDQLVAPQQRGGPWCACGLPGLPGMRHTDGAECVPLAPRLPATAVLPTPGRAPFEPYVPSADREQA
ncbi:hypothetical protein [Streptosporangium jomthongense]|uniref:Uncharacterized protein n=1 Tax=Streptosporangium jomthongense TaxID=1193683 RepID=A0ABV8EXZ5_9ACTN